MSTNKKVSIEERKENNLDSFTFMNVDGWIFGIHTFVGIKTEAVLLYTTQQKNKIKNISDILKCIFSCYASKHWKYAGNQYLLFCGSFLLINILRCQIKWKRILDTRKTD